VGDSGTIAHWNGSAWTSVPSGTTNHLVGVWGSGASDVWAVGNSGTIAHWNGSAWTSVPSGTTNRLAGVWGSGTSDVWTVGDSGTIAHWNGSAWTSVPSGTTSHLASVWGDGTGDVWAVGNSGTIVRWDGEAWSSVSSGTTNDLTGVWETGASDVWAVGEASTILERRPSTRSTPDSSRPGCEYVRGASELRYFGFFCSSCSWVGTEQCRRSFTCSYTNVVKDFSNVVWISGLIDHVVRELQLAEQRGVKAIVSALSFDPNPAYWEQTIEPKMRPFADRVIGFYVADDYFGGSMQQYITNVKRHFPNAATIAILFEQVPEVPEGLDWIGLEAYFQVFGISWSDFQRQTDTLLGMMRPHQRLILVPEVFNDSYTPGLDMSAYVEPNLNRLLSMATNNPRVVGIFPFLWQSDGETATGAERLLGYRERIIQAGTCFVP
jgi:hypothetical protein